MLTLVRHHLRRSPRIRKGALVLRGVVQRGVWFVLDAFEALLGRRDPLTPPRHLINVGSNQFTRGDFNTIGQELFQYLVGIGGLAPGDRVLDVGCGVGRMARPLTGYLSLEGTYDGFDIVAESVDQCRKAYSSGFSNFHFHHADLFNSTYNPGGRYQSQEYRFPFPDNTFSFVFLTSVFTHMLSRGVENYLNEIQRVLVPGGRCFITFFILNPESEASMRGNRNSIQFEFPVDQGKSAEADKPEDAVAFNEPFIRALYRQVGLRIVEPIRYGSWSGRKTEVGYQDIVVAFKPARNESGSQMENGREAAAVR